jgi:hypothetical protein
VVQAARLIEATLKIPNTIIIHEIEIKNLIIKNKMKKYKLNKRNCSSVTEVKKNKGPVVRKESNHVKKERKTCP